MDKFKQIESFVAVAQRGSLTQAAQAEGVAFAVISRRLDALEARLGVKLLVRTTRRVSLTHEGSAFLEDCQRLLLEFASAEATVSAGGVKAVAEYVEIPSQFTIIFSSDHARRCRLAWRIGCEFGAEFID